LCLAGCFSFEATGTRADAIAACEALRRAECTKLTACLPDNYASVEACLQDPEVGSSEECAKMIDSSPCPLAAHAPAFERCAADTRAKTCSNYCVTNAAGAQTCTMYSCFIACGVPKT